MANQRSKRNYVFGQYYLEQHGISPNAELSEGDHLKSEQGKEIIQKALEKEQAAEADTLQGSGQCSS